ncbi:aldo/keto reductase [Kribbella jiaozuonensis]|uniref:Aldo/keto reductase n=1 Tax=Kribbella jiaozuonensis TaxID=2575441 RepID=A0A4U3LLX4_9ACTN|nr:aldo/keto reductase [Kribbella jiaozuonensis]TKK76139.1 aldo/keto reductase [Kribbella jiaozuonensis]
MSLRTVPFGTTGMDITRVGFGAWAIGGGEWAYGWGTQDDRASIDAIRRAIEAGVNWIDTAAVYGLGHSEELVARAVKPYGEADRPYVFTKCGLVWDRADRGVEPRRSGHAASIRREVEGSLRRLRTERIDLYQMHWPAPEPIEEYWEVLAQLKAAGKVRAIGLSNHDTKQLERAERIAPVDALQPPYSLINRDAAAELDWCHSNGTGVIVYSPMQSGLLSGAFTAERAATLPFDDWRSGSADFLGRNLMRNLALVDALRPIANRHRTSVASIAIAWCLSRPGVTAAIVGARHPRQVDGWISAPDVDLDATDLIEIADALRRTGAGHGEIRP